MREYELALVLNPDLDDDGVAEVLVRVTDIVTKGHGTAEEPNHWGKRHLAYPVNEREEGIYVFLTFSADSDVPAELTRVFGFNENVLRHLIVHSIPEAPVVEPRVVTKRTELFIPAKAAKESAESATPAAPAAEATETPEATEAPAAIEAPEVQEEANFDADGKGSEEVPAEVGEDEESDTPAPEASPEG